MRELKLLALNVLVTMVFSFVYSPQSHSQASGSAPYFNIPAQSLDSALVLFSMQADISIVGLTDSLKQHVVPEVRGYKAWRDVLEALLAGSGLEYRLLNSDTVSIFLVETAAATAAEASPEPSSKTSLLEEVVVSATRRSSNLQDTPIAVTAMGQATLDRLHASDLRDINVVVPGLEMINSPSQAAILVQLRGVGTTNITEIADGPVAIHIDGVYTPRSQSAAALLYDVERIEVLRGPQGTLFGRNSSSGSINVYHNKPVLDAVSADLLIAYGNYNQMELRGAFNLPVSDTFSLRVAGARNKHSAYTDLLDNYAGVAPHYPPEDAQLSDFQRALNLGQSGPETADQSGWRVAAKWQPNDNFSAYLSSEDYRDQGTGFAELDPALVNRGIRGVVIDSPTFLNMSNKSLRSQLEYNFSDNYILSYIYGRSRMNRQQIFDSDSGRDGSFEQQHTDSSKFNFYSHEVQILNSDKNRLRWVLGAYTSHEKNRIVFSTDQQNAGGGRSPQGASSWISDLGGAAVFYAAQPDRRVESLGVFAQATYDLNEVSRLTLGSRYARDTKSDHGGRSISCRVPSVYGPYTVTGSVGPGAPGADQVYADPQVQEAIARGIPYGSGTSNGIGSEPCWITQVNDFSATWNNTSGLIRYDVDLSQDSMLYVSAATGFKSGHIQDAGNNAAPETVINYELGIKSLFPDLNLRVNTALYHAVYDDLQYSNLDRLDTDGDGIADTGGSTVVRNASKATVNGIELELEWAIAGAGHLQLSATFMDARFNRFEIPDTLFGNLFNPYVSEGSSSPLDPVDLSGNSPPRTPKWKLAVAYERGFPIFDGILTPRVQVIYSDEYYLDIYNRNRLAAGIFPHIPNGGDNLGVQKSYRTFDLSVGYTPVSKKWMLEAFAKNVTDEDIKIAAGNFITAQGFTAIYMPPRTYGLTLSFAFGDK